MITRHLAETQIVTAFGYKQFTSCSGTYTCSCGTAPSGALGNVWAGFIVDRLGLNREFHSVLIAPSAFVGHTFSATTCQFFYGLELGLQHASSTAGSWQDYSTGDWPARQALFLATTTTSTATDLYTSKEGFGVGNVNTGLLSTAGCCTSSTGYSAYISTQPQAIPLAAAKRFLRVIVRPQVELVTCAATPMDFMASLVFGDATEAPANTSSIRGRVLVTSGCSTATATTT